MKRLAPLVALLFASMAPAPVADAASATCDIIIQIGDSLTSATPTTYLDAYPLPTAILAGAGRSISVDDIREGVVAVRQDGETAVWWWNDHHTSLDDVALVRMFASPTQQLCWIVATGSNDVGHAPSSEWNGLIDQLAAAIGDDPAVWVDVYVNSPDFPNYSPGNSSGWNLRLERHGLDVIDWAAQARVHPEWFDAGGIHLTPAAYAIRASMIADAVNSRWG